MKADKRIKQLTYNGFGFPVLLLNVPARVIRGSLEPIVDYKTLGSNVILLLCSKETPLTGNQIRFIRLYFELSLREFAKSFGLTHQAVMKWEKYNDDFANIQPAIEKSVRFEALFRLGVKPIVFHKTFGMLQNLAQTLQDSEADHDEPLKIAV